MLEVTISYDRLLKRLQNVLNRSGFNHNDEVSLIVVKGYPNKDYVSIVDLWIDGAIEDKTVELLNEGDNQELLPYDWVYKELSEMNGKKQDYYDNIKNESVTR